MYALVELAGLNHTKFIPDLLYWYDWSGLTRAKTKCFYEEVLYYEYVSRQQTPLIALNSLSDEVKITSEYVIPSNITERFKKI